jgi:serine/threonine protein kinase
MHAHTLLQAASRHPDASDTGRRSPTPAKLFVFPVVESEEGFAPPDSIMGGVNSDVLAGRFRVLECIAAGGMGKVHRGWDDQENTQVAIKFVLNAGEPVAYARFARECEIVAGLNAPGIVRVRGFGSSDQGPYLVMDWIQGASLSERIRQTGLSAGEVVTLAKQLVTAIGVVHSNGFVHRDLKPSNVLLRNDKVEDPVLIDFGVARHVEGALQLTKTGAMVGTAAYMAPEQVKGQKGIDHRADFFSLGCLLYHALAGQPPFFSFGRAVVNMQVVCTDPEPLTRFADIPPDLAALVTQLLSKRREDRPNDTKTILDRLAELGALPHDGVRRPGNSRTTMPTRRPKHDSRTRTVTAEQADAPGAEDVWVLAMGLADGTEDTDSSVVLNEAKIALAKFPLVVSSVEDTLVAMFSPDSPRSGRGHTTAGAAMILRKSHPTLPIVVTSGNSPSIVLDRAASMLQMLDLKTMFAQKTESLPIHLDSTAATKLQKTHTVLRDGEHYILTSEDSVHTKIV